MSNVPAIQMQILGMDKLLSRLTLWQRFNSSTILMRAMLRVGKEVEIEALNLLQEKVYDTPPADSYIRTGLLKMKTTTDEKVSRDGSEVTIGVSAKTNYAKYVEFGTPNMPARAFLYPAGKKVEAEMMRILGDAVMDFMEQTGA